jgi:polysaccharide biosynthesis/export protein
MPKGKFSPSGFLLTAAIITLMVFACVPIKKITYIQKDDVKTRPKNLDYDTLVRFYDRSFKEYRLEPNDIVSVRIGSITPSDFNFIKEYEEQLGQIRKLNQYGQSNFLDNQSNRTGGIGSSQGLNEFNIGLQQFLTDIYLSGFRIDNGGSLFLPKVGEIRLAGLTMAEAEDSLKNRFEGYFETPIVKLELMSFHFSVFGEVQNEGRYTSYNTKTSVFDAIAMAGNMNNFADRSKIKLVRFEDGLAKVAYLNTLSEDLFNSEYYYLRPNDHLIVPPLKSKTWFEYLLPTAPAIITMVTTLTTLIILIVAL